MLEIVLSLHFVPTLESAVCCLHFVLSLHFISGLHSAVCSLHFVLIGIRGTDTVYFWL